MSIRDMTLMAMGMLAFATVTMAVELGGGKLQHAWNYHGYLQGTHAD